MEIRDLESLRPLVASSLRSAATAQGPRLSKSRISTDSLYNLLDVIGHPPYGHGAREMAGVTNDKESVLL